MKIEKLEALALAKVLHQHISPYAPDDESDHEQTLRDIAERVDDFLVNGEDEDEDDCCDHSCKEKDDEEAEDDTDAEEEDSSEEDEEDDEGESDGEGSEDSEDDEEELETYDDVDGDDLHALKAAKSKEGALEFEHDVSVHVLLDGCTEVSDVTHVKRLGKELHARDEDGNWHVFHVARFPKPWIDLFTVGELYGVTHE